MPLFKIYDKSHNFAKPKVQHEYTKKHSNTNLLQSNTEEAIKTQNENIIFVTNLLTHQSDIC